MAIRDYSISADKVDFSPSRCSITVNKDHFVFVVRFLRLRVLVWFCCLLMIQELAAEIWNHCIFPVHKTQQWALVPCLIFPDIVTVQKIKQ